eukprot:tig00021127_g18744.t1
MLRSLCTLGASTSQRLCTPTAVRWLATETSAAAAAVTTGAAAGPSSSAANPARHGLPPRVAEIMRLSPETMTEIKEHFGYRTADTTSFPIQMAMRTRQIEKLHAYLKQNPADAEVEAGIKKLLQDRSRMARFMKRHDFKFYKRVVRKDKPDLR